MPKDKIGDVKVMNNEYDNEKFFEEYAKMSRSKEGLKAAGAVFYFPGTAGPVSQDRKSVV